MSSKLFTKNNKSREKWARKFGTPQNHLPVNKLSFWQQIYFLLVSPKEFFEAGGIAINKEKIPLINDRTYDIRMSANLGEYLHWYFESKGFLHSVDWMGIPTRKIPSDMWVY